MASPIARRLRETPTDAEKKLWSRLRENQVGGFRFRRQQPIGDYVVDFFCPDTNLIVEVDGGQHAETIGRDDMRTGWLESKGYRVVRFWNDEVLGNIDGVVERIHEALRALPPTPPSPSRGEGDA